MVEKLYIAQSVDDAVSYIKKGWSVLAGGTEINRLGSFVKAENLVSIGRIEGLDNIEKVSLETEELSGKFIKIGATCTFTEVISDNLVPQYLKNACLYMSSMQRRNMATIGGNIAAVRDDSYIISTLIAAGAKLEIVIASGDTVIVEVSDYAINSDRYNKSFILDVLLPVKVDDVKSKRFANTEASHGFITMALWRHRKTFRLGLSIKNSGTYFFTEKDIEGLKNIPLSSDMFGSKEYKEYLIQTTKEELL